MAENKMHTNDLIGCVGNNPPKSQVSGTPNNSKMNNKRDTKINDTAVNNCAVYLIVFI